MSNAQVRADISEKEIACVVQDLCQSWPPVSQLERGGVHQGETAAAGSRDLGKGKAWGCLQLADAVLVVAGHASPLAAHAELVGQVGLPANNPSCLL